MTAILLLSIVGIGLIVTFKHEIAPFLDWAAVVAAIILGYAAYRATAQQAFEARRATELSHQPLLVPLHEGGLRLPEPAVKHFPARQPTPMEDRPSVRYLVQAALVKTVKAGLTREDWRVIAHLKNVGQGAAIILDARVWNGAGQMGRLSGAKSVGAGEISTFVAELSEDLRGGLHRALDAITLTGQRWGLQEQPERWVQEEAIRLYFLEITYTDVFGRPDRRCFLKAWFDPMGFGGWHVISDLRVPAV